MMFIVQVLNQLWIEPEKLQLQSFSAYLQNEGIAEANGKDLGALIELLVKRNDKNGQRIVACAAEIPQRLHSRGKHAEQEKHDNLRPIREQDAELAVQCIGVMLCDLGWGRWV
jgi:hypothetical protein